MKSTNFCDPFVRYVKDIPEPPIGLSIIEFSRIRPGPAIHRGREAGFMEENRSYPRDKGELLCRGAAVGLDKNGICRHIWPHLAPLRFAGIALANLPDNQVLVMTSGAVFLRIPGLTPEDHGSSVYAENLDKFTLKNQKTFVKVGIVRFVQPDAENKACVAFQRWNSKEELEPLRRYL